jgi:hypothetical protein
LTLIFLSQLEIQGYYRPKHATLQIYLLVLLDRQKEIHSPRVIASIRPANLVSVEVFPISIPSSVYLVLKNRNITENNTL